MFAFPSQPLPPKLKAFLVDYPDCVDRLQRALDRALAGLLPGTPAYEQAIWALDAELLAAQADAEQDVEAARRVGDADAETFARAKRLRIAHAGAGMPHFTADLWVALKAVTP